MNKIILKYATVSLILILLSIILITILSSRKKDESTLLKEKSTSALFYLETNILSMLDNLNHSSIDWQSLDKSIEKLHVSWSNTIIDLYKLNIDANEVQNFSNTLDLATQYMNATNMQQAVLELNNLYQYISKYMKAYLEDETTVTLMTAKALIVSAYAKVSEANWNGVREDLSSAEAVLLLLVNDVEYNKNVDNNIQKTYVLLKELQNTSKLNDRSLFYIKYKNLMKDILL